MRLREWTLHERLSWGGYGEIWRATTHRHPKPVAIKLLRSRMGDRWRLSELGQELPVLAGLRHRGVVRLLDGGEVSASEASPSVEMGTGWLAMELISGRTLADITAQRGEVGLLGVLRDLLEVLSYVHGRGYIHRDLSLRNVMWSVRDRCAKVIDFGLAQQVGAVASRRHGTAGFVAPEVLGGTALGPPADLYSVGVIGTRLLELGMQRPDWVRGLPLDRLTVWLDGLRVEDPGARPPTAVAARRWLDALLGSASTRSWQVSAGDRPATPREPATLTATAAEGELVGPPLGGVSASRAFMSFWEHLAPAELPDTAPDVVSAALELGWMCPGLSLFRHRPVGLVARDSARDRLWSALGSSVECSDAITVQGPPGVGVSSLLAWLRLAAHGCDAVELMHTPSPDPGGRGVPLWLLDDASDACRDFARAPRRRGLVVLGRGTVVGQALTLDLIPISHRAELVRAMLPVSADVAGWCARACEGSPGRTRQMLEELLESESLVQGDEVYDWVVGRRPPWAGDSVSDTIEEARGEFEAAANEQAWSRLAGLQLGGLVEEDSPHREAWIDLVLLLADRLPQVLHASVLPRPRLPPQDDPAWAQTVMRMGQRAQRCRDHVEAEACFSRLHAAAETPEAHAAATWQLGATAFVRGDYVAALSWFEECLRHCSTDPPSQQAAHGLLAVSLVLSNLGHFEDALWRGEEATAAFSAIGQPRHIANLLDFQSTCHLWLGDLQAAERCARESLERWARDGSPNRLVPLLNLVAALYHQGHRELVQEMLDEVGRRALVEQPRLMGVVALYGVLFAAHGGDREGWEFHWSEHERAWAQGDGWHPATGRMLWDIWQETLHQPWPGAAETVLRRLHAIRERYGAEVLARFGVPQDLSAATA